MQRYMEGDFYPRNKVVGNAPFIAKTWDILAVNDYFNLRYASEFLLIFLKIFFIDIFNP